MALINCTIAAQADTAQAKAEFIFAGWPPLFPPTLTGGSSTALSDPYPLLDPINPLEVVSADGVTAGDGLGPENRVAIFARQRTDLLRGYVNTLVRLVNLLSENFIDRDGVRVGLEAADTTYMRGNLDLGGFKIRNMAAASADTDLVTFAQFKVVQFAYEDELDEANQALLQRDGSNTMAAALDMGVGTPGRRVTNVGVPTQSDHIARQTDQDTQLNAFASGYLARTGVLAMTNSGAAWDLGNNGIIGLADPVNDGDGVPKKWFEDQLAIGGLAGVPVGTILPHFGGTVPQNFLLCDGTEVARTGFSQLFAVIGIAYGTPSGGSTFVLPDLRGRSIVGQDDMGGTQAGRITASWARTLGGTGGAQNHILTSSEIPAHDHDFDDAYFATGTGGALTGNEPAGTAAANTIHAVGRVTSPAGSSSAHNNLQPTMACLWIIRAA